MPKTLSFEDKKTETDSGRKSKEPEEQKPVKLNFDGLKKETEKELKPEPNNPVVIKFENRADKIPEKIVSKGPVTLRFSENNKQDNAKPQASAPDKVVVIMPGAVTRIKIEVSLEELQNLDQVVQSEETLRKAQSIIRVFNFEDSRDEKFEEFGLASQQRYATDIQEMFEIAKGSHIEEAQGTIKSIAEIIKSIDFKILLDDQPEKKSIWNSIFGEEKPDKETLKKDFEVKYGQIKSDIKKLQKKLPYLNQVKERFDRFSKSIPSIIEELEAVTVAGRFLVQHGKNLLAKLKTDTENIEKRNEAMRLETVLPIFEKRIDSVVLTKISLLQGIEQVKLLRMTVLGLTNLIQDTLLVTVPLWWNSYLNVFLVASSKNQTSKYQEIKNLLQMQSDILEKLNV